MILVDHSRKNGTKNKFWSREILTTC